MNNEKENYTLNETRHFRVVYQILCSIVLEIKIKVFLGVRNIDEHSFFLYIFT